MSRHFVFFANPMRPELFIHDANFTFVALDGSVRKLLTDYCQSISDVTVVFAKAPHVCAVFFKNDLPDEGEAFRQAYERVTALIDVFSLLTFEIPKLLPVAITASDGEQKAKVRAFGFDTTGRAFIGEIEEKFLRHGEFVLKQLLPAFDVASGIHANSQNEVADQLSTLAKMYRHGRLALDLQMQFLSKFTAMEGLVCGSQQNGHGQLLRTRLPELFKARLSTARINELWKLRCRASHAGAGSWREFSAALPDVELLVVGCAIFAAEHLKQVNTIKDLWPRASGYSLPPQLFEDVWGHNSVERFVQELGWLDASLLQLDRIYVTASGT